ncbi:CoA transferase [Kitasatospora mediocidica]|uniref:CoA transferase n=1 Tax=Kitasatospora mediocidica TaxID=58352 RepID=UPI0009FF9227|nr:CoA transferase [Kitasatospora mediocidica]
MTEMIDEPTAQAWAALGGAPELVAGVAYEGPGDGLPSGLPVRELARATVGVCSLAAAELLAARNGGGVPAVRVDEGAVATAFVSERHLRIDGRAPVSFAPLSGFWRTADGWVRTHANYPHHRARLLSALGLPDTDADGDEIMARRLAVELAGRTAESVQEAVYAAGGLAVAVVPPARPAPVLPLVEARRLPGGAARVLPPAALPAAGVRVLDLTRVIAGPVATRTLALLGADVLRVDSPHLPESEEAHADTGFGKRSTRLDLQQAEDRAVFEQLLDSADVLVTGYRPGALASHGLSPDALAQRRPGLVVAELCAWGWSGPWSARRGFDSLVQAGCGIAVTEAAADGRPGVLPAQALDHGTGYLLAAAVLRALTERQKSGDSAQLRCSLAGTAGWLTDGIRTPAPGGDGTHQAARWLGEVRTPHGLLTYALPPIGYAGAPADWSRGPGLWGTDTPTWA